jgi:hypothetical protein
MRIDLRFENRKGSYKGLSITIESNQAELAWELVEAIKNIVKEKKGWQES